MRTLIVGDVFRPSSFANVNMHMAYYLRKMGHDLTVMSKFPLTASLPILLHKYMPYKSDAYSVFGDEIIDDDEYILNEEFDNVIYFLVDPDKHNPKYKSKKNIFFTVWSHQNYPTKWAEALNKWDEVWCPSQANFNAIVEAGGPVAKLKIVPHGYEPDIFFHDKKKHQIMRFGMCNSICNFKGADLAIQSFIECFEPKDNVELVIMSTKFQRESDNGKDKHGIYYDEYIGHLNKYNKQVKTYYTARDCSLPEMADFYRSCDVILSPHRGDGFGLVGLEALACGVPVIVSDYHGPKDYIKADYPFFLSGKMDWTSRESGKHHWPDGGTDGEVYKYFEPDKEHLKYLINMAYNDVQMRAELQTKEYFKGLTWEQVCEIASKLLKGEN